MLDYECGVLARKILMLVTDKYFFTMISVLEMCVSNIQLSCTQFLVDDWM